MTAKPRTSKPALSLTLDTISLHDALDALTTLESGYRVIPDAARNETISALTSILAAAERLRLTSVRELITHLPNLLDTLAGTTGAAAEAGTPAAAKLHTHRNIALALAVAAAALHGCDPKAVLTHAVRLPARTKESIRPLTNDEVFLLRTYAAILSRSNPTSVVASTCALTLAGLTPGETTHVTVGCFNDPRDPSQVKAAGNRAIASRVCPLDAFEQAILGRHTRQSVTVEDSTTHLTYRPRKNVAGTPAATASAQGVLDRTITLLGVKNADVTASSIALWRVHTVYTTDGVAAAIEASGRGTETRTLTAINIGLLHTPKKTSTTKPKRFLQHAA
jgi:hypothetical protein